MLVIRCSIHFVAIINLLTQYEGLNVLNEYVKKDGGERVIF